MVCLICGPEEPCWKSQLFDSVINDTHKQDEDAGHGTESTLDAVK